MSSQSRFRIEFIFKNIKLKKMFYFCSPRFCDNNVGCSDIFSPSTFVTFNLFSDMRGSKVLVAKICRGLIYIIVQNFSTKRLNHFLERLDNSPKR